MIDNDFIALVNTGVKHSTDNWGTGVILQHPVTGRILLARRTDGEHQFASPGGKVEMGESPKDGILRECLEESNVAIKDMCCYDFRTHSAPNGKNWVDFLFYSNSFDDSDIQNQESEMEPFDWYDVDEALSLDLFPPTRAGLERAIELGLVSNPEKLGFIEFVDCPRSASEVMDSVTNAYSYEEPETVFVNNQGFYWD